MPLIPAFGRQRQADLSEFCHPGLQELVSEQAPKLQRSPALKNKTKQQQNVSNNMLLCEEQYNRMGLSRICVVFFFLILLSKPEQMSEKG